MSFYVFDLDNTISDPSHRLHHVKNGNHNWDAFFTECVDDKPKWDTIYLMRQLYRLHNQIEIWSGRSDVVLDKTIAWLEKHQVPYHGLQMRSRDDHQKDVDLKRSWLHDLGDKSNYPDIVFDDRQSVVDMWRSEGVTCFQVDQWNDMDLVGEKCERIKPLNTEESMLIVMVGPSGAGKSRIAADYYSRSVISRMFYVSSDIIRQQLCGDFMDQSRNVDVFRACHTLIKTYIDCGIPVIYDATNIKNKDRLAAVKCCPEDYKVQYWVVDRPLEDKVKDGCWRNSVLIKGKSLIEYHDDVFKSNLRDIMNGDQLRNVEVIDYRVDKA